MSALQPPQRIMQLEMQPHFPMEDLSDGNSEILKLILRHNAGVDAYANQLQDRQRYIHLIADKALRLLGIPTVYDRDELFSFSHGFVGFETISDLVHGPRVYDYELAADRVAQFFVDTRDLFDIELEREIYGPAATIDEKSYEQPTIESDGLRLEVPDTLYSALAEPQKPIGHDKPKPENVFTERHHALAENYPNTFDVITAMGVARGETMSQLQVRTAGAGLARLLQTLD